MITQGFRESVEVNVGPINGFEFIDVEAVVHFDDQVCVAYNRFLRVEQVSLNIVIQVAPATWAFTVSYLVVSYLIDPRLFADAAPIPPSVSGIVGIAAQEFIDDILAVEVARRP